MCNQVLLKPVEAEEEFEGALTFPTHRWKKSHSKFSFTCHSHVSVSSRLHSAHLSSLQILTFSTPVVTQPNAVYVQGNLGPSTKLSWLFLLWADAPTSVAAAAKYVMFFCSVPKRASSELIDSKIILGGMEGWGLKHTRDHAGPWGQKVCSVGCV